jgi:hypothetical protein
MSRAASGDGGRSVGHCRVCADAVVAATHRMNGSQRSPMADRPIADCWAPASRRHQRQHETILRRTGPPHAASAAVVLWKISELAVGGPMSR